MNFSNSTEKMRTMCERLIRNDPGFTSAWFDGRDRIETDDAVAFAAALSNNTKLKTIAIGEWDVGVEGIVAIFNGLQHNSSVEQLIVSSNCVGVEAAEALRATLGLNQTLKEVTLDCCQIGDSQAIVLAKGLQNNCSVKTLYMPCNHIGKAGAVALGKMLEPNQTLERLYLGNNPFSISDVAAVFTESMETNMTLRRLDIGGGTSREWEQTRPARFHVALNTSGKRLLKMENIHPCLWAHLLAKVGRRNLFDRGRVIRHLAPSMVYYFLQQKPDLCGYLATQKNCKQAEDDP